MTEYRVVHTTEYSATSPVSVCHNQAWLQPRSTNRQQVVSHDLVIEPSPSILTTRNDAFGNHVSHLSFNEGYEHLEVRSESRIEIATDGWPETGPAWEESRDQIQSDPSTHLDEFQFTFSSRMVRTANEFAEYARQDFRPGRSLIEALADLTKRINAEFEYDPRATTISTPVEHVFQHRKGVCQDFAHVQIAMLRSLGLPARYVSGYVRTGNLPDRPDMIGADASHAWLACFDSTIGWIEADPTNATLTNEDHVTVAWGRDYSDIPPLRGVFLGGGRHSLKVGVKVEPIS